MRLFAEVFSVFADDGAIWKRGRNVEYIVQKMQEAILKIERWAMSWGFKFSVEKTKTMIFTRRRRGREVKLRLFNRELERVKEFQLLVIWFDERLTWAGHNQKVTDKCKT